VSHPRWPRKDESMLSINGSPLANPYQLGLGYANWLRADDNANGDREDGKGSRGGGGVEGNGKKGGHKRTNSIIIRSVSNSSVASSSRPPNSKDQSQSQGQHSRSNSQTTLHPNTNTNGNGFIPTRHHNSTSPTVLDPPDNPFSFALPSRPVALVSVPTKDGHVLEFDPLQTSPGEIDALEGISDSAKKQAKDDIARLVMQAVERWKIT